MTKTPAVTFGKVKQKCVCQVLLGAIFTVCPSVRLKVYNGKDKCYMLVLCVVIELLPRVTPYIPGLFRFLRMARRRVLLERWLRISVFS